MTHYLITYEPVILAVIGIYFRCLNTPSKTPLSHRDPYVLAQVPFRVHR
jgi:hypothetical protein